MDQAQGAIEALRQACRTAVMQLGSQGSFRLRALLGMLLHEIDLEIERTRERKRERPQD